MHNTYSMMPSLIFRNNDKHVYINIKNKTNSGEIGKHE